MAVVVSLPSKSMVTTRSALRNVVAAERPSKASSPTPAKALYAYVAPGHLDRPLPRTVARSAAATSLHGLVASVRTGDRWPPVVLEAEETDEPVAGESWADAGDWLVAASRRSDRW